MEEWKTVIIDNEVFENYEVSNTGKVRSLGNDKTRKTKLLKPRKQKTGYLLISVRKNGIVKQCLVHRVVAYTWIPNNDETKTEVNHINENKQDNRVENLEWCDRNYNIHHGTGIERSAEQRRKYPKREKRERQTKRVLCIETNTVYDSIRQAEEKTGIPHANIIKVCQGKLKTCGGYTWKYVD